MKYVLATTSVVALLMAGPAMAQTTGNQNQTTGKPAAGAGGADITVKQPPPVVTVDPKAPNVTVYTEKPDVKVTQPPPKVTVTEQKPDVSVQTGDPAVKVDPAGKPDVTVVRPGDRDVGSGTTAAPAARDTAGRNAVAPTANVSPLAAEAESFIGRNVYGTNGEDIGEIQNLLIGTDGRVRAAVIEFGGFLGIGENEVAVPWDQLSISGDRATVNMTEAQIKAQPRWTRDRPGEFVEYRPFR